MKRFASQAIYGGVEFGLDRFELAQRHALQGQPGMQLGQSGLGAGVVEEVGGVRVGVGVEVGVVGVVVVVAAAAVEVGFDNVVGIGCWLHVVTPNSTKNSPETLGMLVEMHLLVSMKILRTG